MNAKPKSLLSKACVLYIEKILHTVRLFVSETMALQTISGAWLLFGLVLWSCEQKNEALLLAEAQACLNKMGNKGLNSSGTLPEALQCVSKIESLTIPEAYQLRCAAIFVAQGFNEAQRLEAIVSHMKESNSQNQSALVTLGLFAFKTIDDQENKQLSQRALEQCVKSKSPAMALLASLAHMSTQVATINNAVITQCQIDSQGQVPPECGETMRDNFCDNTGENDVVFGETIQVVMNISCHNSSQPFCSVFQEALNSNSTPATIGQAFRERLCVP